MLIPETVARLNARVTDRVRTRTAVSSPGPFAWCWGCST
jgi:hypothetical protein